MELTRRRALQLGLIGAAGAVVGGVGLARQGWSPLGDRGPTGVAPGAASTPAGSVGWAEPGVLHAVDGLLEVDLVAATTTTVIGGRAARLLAYSGTTPGSTWRLTPGDRLRVRLRNELDAPTNLHVHGLHVPPTGAGDDPFVRVEPGAGHDYDYTVPSDHPTGTFWYHPHHHGTVADQVSGGLHGAIVLTEPDPPPVAADRVMVVSDVSLTTDGQLAPVTAMDRMLGREGDLVLVNGLLAPTLDTAAGAVERWRVVNACVARYLHLDLQGVPMTLLGIDGGREPAPTPVTGVVLAPGNRADLLVTVPGGTTVLRTLPVDRGHAMMARSPGGRTPVELLTVRGSGAPDAAAPSPSLAGPVPRDLRPLTPARTRDVTLAMGMGRGMGGGMSVTIDGREFDPTRTDLAVRLGDVEEWTFRNTSTMNHPMHLHVWPMQVVARNGDPVTGTQWRDVVDVPAGGTTTVRVAFDDYPGTTVVHCHVLDHEDLGMMATVIAR